MGYAPERRVRVLVAGETAGFSPLLAGNTRKVQGVGTSVCTLASCQSVVLLLTE
jgi:hypothetical protein